MNPPPAVAEKLRVNLPQLVSTVTRGVETIKNYISMTRADVLTAIRNAETAVLTPLERGMSASVRPLSSSPANQNDPKIPQVTITQLNLHNDIVPENATCVALSGVELKCGAFKACCVLTSNSPLFNDARRAYEEVRLTGPGAQKSEVAVS